MSEVPSPADPIDHAFVALASGELMRFPIIACLYTGKMPEHCAPMPRIPSPPLGQGIDQSLASALCEAVWVNEAVHDGAIMFGRRTIEDPFRITGWSYRMFPPERRAAATANRGSAFHSSLSMSLVQGVERLYLVSKEAAFRFQGGRWIVLREATVAREHLG